MNAQKANNTIEKVQQLQRKLYLAAKKNSKRKFHALYDKIYRDDILKKHGNESKPMVEQEELTKYQLRMSKSMEWKIVNRDKY